MRAIALIWVSAAALVIAASPALADPPPGGGSTITCVNGVCQVTVTGGGHTGGGGNGHGAVPGGGCAWKGQPELCSDPRMGSFHSSDGCYYKVADPLPTSGPVLAQYQQAGGGVYWATCPFGGGARSGGYVWLPKPPAGLPPSPAQLAQQAEASFKFSRPSGHRSPSENLRYRGYPFSYVNLWLFYWTDPVTWKTLTATARAGGNWATVTAKPVSLTFAPGDGSSSVSCAGPGRAWTDTDGNNAPGGGACGFQYKQVTSSPITSTQTITWKITWVGSGTTSGTLPDRLRSTAGQLNVMQIQTVVTK